MGGDNTLLFDCDLKAVELLKHLAVFDASVRAKFIESRLSIEKGFVGQPYSHNDVVDLHIPYHNQLYGMKYIELCNNKIGVDFISPNTLKFKKVYFCASVENGLSIEVKCTKTGEFDIKPREAHRINKQKIKDSEVESGALHLTCRHSDFYLFIETCEPEVSVSDKNEPVQENLIPHPFHFIKDYWLIPTCIIESSLSDFNDDKLSKDDVIKLENKIKTRKSRKMAPETVALLVSLRIKQWLISSGEEIFDRKISLDQRKQESFRNNGDKYKKKTRSTVPEYS